jgi:hypothetical protein
MKYELPIEPISKNELRLYMSKERPLYRDIKVYHLYRIGMFSCIHCDCGSYQCPRYKRWIMKFD